MSNSLSFHTFYGVRRPNKKGNEYEKRLSLQYWMCVPYTVVGFSTQMPSANINRNVCYCYDSSCNRAKNENKFLKSHFLWQTKCWFACSMLDLHKRPGRMSWHIDTHTHQILWYSIIKLNQSSLVLLKWMLLLQFCYTSWLDSMQDLDGWIPTYCVTDV